ncbi:hypothetical protein WJX77_002015 [Trebouxia sp. C0004]
MGLSADDPRLGRVAFAKLQGDGLEYFVRKYEVWLGRKSKSTELDIVLGDNMNISRQHAKIAYNFSLGVFELTVMGKNGVTVNGILHTPSSAPQQLYTQDFLQVGEQKFFFLLPKGTSRRRPPSASPPANKPEGAAAATEGEQIQFSGPAGDEELMDAEVPDQAAKPVMNIEIDRGSIQPQGTGSHQDQRLNHSEALPAAQPQNLAATSSLGRPIIQT